MIDFNWTDDLVEQYVQSIYPRFTKEHLETFKKSVNKLSDYVITGLKRKSDSKIFNNLSYCKENYSWYWNMCRDDYEIYSVRRLSDGEEFTVGEETEQGKIEEFAIIRLNDYGRNRDEVRVKISNADIDDRSLETKTIFNKDVVDLHHLTKKKLKTPLFTTDDGVDVNYGDCVYGVGWLWIVEQYFVDASTVQQFLVRSHKTFSTKANAEQYILLNKPIVSLQEIFDLNSNDRDKIVELAKQKMHQ